MMRVEARTCRVEGRGGLRPGGRLRVSAVAARGATLIEVLMALMVMGIGVVSVATLFPIAILRSVQATQITNATILRLNAEAMIEIDRRIVHDPDNDNSEDEHWGKTYIVDPLGWNTLSNAPPDYQNKFGTDGNGSLPAGLDLPRYNAGRTTLAEAESLVTLADSWVRVISVTDATVTLNQVTLNGDFIGDLTELQSALGTVGVRLTVLSEDGSQSQIRTLLAGDINPAANTVTINPPLPSDGNDGNYDQASVVWLETQQRNYTWLLTVRKNAVGVASVDVVVYFRRSLPAPNGEPLDERVYEGITAGSNSREWILPADPRPENLKRGGFLFDPDHARWYRIVDLDESGSQIKLVLDKEAPGWPDADESITRATFPRGVVDVFPLKNKL